MGDSATLRWCLILVVIDLMAIRAMAIDVILNDAYVVLGKSFWWECGVGGQGSSVDNDWSYHWRFQGADIGVSGSGDGAVSVKNNGTLYFKEVQEENVGFYSCVVSNNKQEASEGTAFLRKAFVSNTIFTEPTDQSIGLGDSAAFHCDVDAKPEASVDWLHGDEEVKDNDVIQTNTPREGGFTLKVSALTYSDAGVYRCAVRHELLDRPILSDAMRLHVYGEPVITVWLKPRSSPVGHDISLQCRVQSNPASNVTWNFYPTNFTSTSSSSSSSSSSPVPTSTPSTKVTLSKLNSPMTIAQSVVSLNEDNDLILITNASEENSGLYSCEWSNEFGSVVSNASLIVGGLAQPPTILKVPEDQDVVEFSELRLYCSGKGNPSVTISWIVPNGSKEDKVDISESYFVIKEVTRADSGLYKCVVSNSLGTATSDAIVNVLYEPYITIAPSNITLRNASTFEIPCQAEGNPKPVIKWKVPWLDTEIVALSNDVQDISFNDTNLVVSNVQYFHYGIYRCIASNKAGSVSVSASIKVVSGPVMVTSLTSVGVTEGDEILLQCEVRSYQAPKVEWFRKHMADPSIQAINIQETLRMVSDDNLNVSSAGLMKINVDTNVESSDIVAYSNSMNDDYMFYLQIYDVKLSDAGIYVCKVENEVGTTHTFGVVRVISFPQFNRAPLGGKVLLGEDVMLHCHSVGIPIPSQRWLFNGGKLILNSRFVVDSNGSLSVSSIRKEELGIYTCLATNQAGQRSVHAQLLMSSKPRIENPPGNKAFLEFKEGSLNCEGVSDLSYYVMWYKTDNSGTSLELLGQILINISSSEQPGKSDNVTMNGSEYSSNESTMYVSHRGSLIFKCVEKQHQAWYMCKLKNEDGSIESEPAFIKVETLPKAILLTVSDPQSKEGDNIDLTCSVKGLSSSLNGNISWISPQFLEVTLSGQTYYPEILVENKDTLLQGVSVYMSVLKVSGVNNGRHGGEWWCKACNTAGCKVAKTLLDIQGKPVVRSISSTVSNNQIAISCLSFGQPKPEITYLSNNIKIENDTKGHNITDSYLLIDVDGLKGRYSCQATNVRGSDTHILNVPPTPTITNVLPGQKSFHINSKTELPSPIVRLTAFSIEYKKTDFDEKWESRTYQISGDLMQYFRVFNDVQKDDLEQQTCVEDSGENDMKFTTNPSPRTDNVELYLSIDSFGTLFIHSFQSVITTLDAYTMYSIRAKAINAFGVSLSSDIVNMRTLASAPSIIRNIEVSVKNRSCTLTWEKPEKLNGRAEDVVMSVTISYQSIDNIIHTEIVPATEKTSILLNSLSLGEYFATITAFNEKMNVSGERADMRFRIQDQAPSYIPQIVEIRSITQSSINVIWTIPDNPATLIPTVTGYFLLIKTTHSKSSTIRMIQIIDGSISNRTVTRLRENEEYSVRVAAANQAGISPYSPPKRVTTRFAAFSKKALGAADIGGYSISWKLIAIIVIGAGAALVFLTAFLVFSYQLKLAKRGSVDITPEPTTTTNDARNDDSQQEQDPTHVVADSFRDSDFILY